MKTNNNLKGATSQEVAGEVEAALSGIKTKIAALPVFANIVYNWMGMPIILRQFHYRIHEISKLLPAGLVEGLAPYENTASNYKYLSAALSKARFEGTFPWDAMIDNTRTIHISQVHYWRNDKPEPKGLDEIVYDEADRILRYASGTSLDKNLYQQDLVMILLEKQGLEPFFERAMDGLGAYLCASKGFNSTTQINDLAKALKNDGRKIHCKTFTDFDPSGKAIEANFYNQLVKLGVQFKSQERMALTEAQVKFWNLPYAPVKASDSRAKGWTAAGVVEMDAISPVELDLMIKGCITKHYDKSIYKEVKRLEDVLNRINRRRVYKTVDRFIRKLDEETRDKVYATLQNTYRGDDYLSSRGLNNRDEDEDEDDN